MRSTGSLEKTNRKNRELFRLPFALLLPAGRSTDRK
jgi:hypothetical protein